MWPLDAVGVFVGSQGLASAPGLAWAEGLWREDVRVPGKTNHQVASTCVSSPIFVFATYSFRTLHNRVSECVELPRGALKYVQILVFVSMVGEGQRQPWLQTSVPLWVPQLRRCNGCSGCKKNSAYQCLSVLITNAVGHLRSLWVCGIGERLMFFMNTWELDARWTSEILAGYLIHSITLVSFTWYENCLSLNIWNIQIYCNTLNVWMYYIILHIYSCLHVKSIH